MQLIKKKKLKDILELIARYDGSDYRPLIQLVHYLRPSGKELYSDENSEFEELLLRLKSNEQHLEGLKEYLRRILADKTLRRSITEPGIISKNSFFSELKKRLSYKILPYQPQPDTIDSIITNIFYRKTDGIWINKLPEEQVIDLFELLGFQPLQDKSASKERYNEVLFACDVLMQRIVGESIKDDILTRTPEYANFESPFLALEIELNKFIEKEKESQQVIRPDDEAFNQIMVLIGQCDDFVERALKNSKKYGITLSINQSLLIIRQQLYRMKAILSYLPAAEDEKPSLKTVNFIKELIAFNSGKNRVRKFINESTQLLAFEVTQHTGKGGEHYITSTHDEYKKMFKSAAGGGFIVGILCLIKVYLAGMNLSIFGHGFMYSMNYALGFIAIYLFHFTLATKQPAMTAAALALALKSDKKVKIKYKEFSDLFARLFRSQFIAFVGNVVLAFPVALLLITVIYFISGQNPAEYKSEKLLNELDMIKSPAIFHAGIAGVFLFLSGLIAGQANNRSIHHKFPLRIKEHPVLRLTIGLKNSTKLSKLYDKHIGGIAGNFWFGVFMGSTGAVGMFLGLPLDIRHITFASGNLALGLFGAEFSVSLLYILWCILGIGVIGLVNFTVSFTLSLVLAMRARDIEFVDLTKIGKAIRIRFTDNPRDFFLPPPPEEPETFDELQKMDENEGDGVSKKK